MGIQGWFRRTPHDAASLMTRLRSGTPEQKAAAVEDVARIGPPLLQPLLRTLFLCTEEEIPWVARALRRTGDPGLRSVRDALKHPGCEARRCAASALKEFGADGAGAVADLAAALEDVDPDVRWRSAVALGRIGPAARPAVAALEKASRAKGEPKLSTAATESLRAIRS